MVFATTLPSTIKRGLVGFLGCGMQNQKKKKKKKKKKPINNIIPTVPATDVELLKL
jgi:hypothetical protein